MLRGAKNDGPIVEFTPSPAFPAVQYLESVDPNGPAYEAGLRDGDFIIEVKMELDLEPLPFSKVDINGRD